MNLQHHFLALANSALEAAATEHEELAIYEALAEIAAASGDIQCAQIAAMSRAAALAIRAAAARRQEFRDLVQGQLPLAPVTHS